MLPFRRAALRLLSSSPTSFISKPRSLSTFTLPTQSLRRQPALLLSQRRWATGEAEAKQEEAPITPANPEPEEEVEDAIHADNAAADPAQGGSQQSTVQSAINSATETVSNIAARAAETVSSATSRASERSTPESDQSAGYDRKLRDTQQLIGEPKSTIYIGNLFFDVTENDLVKELARFGTITKCRLIRDGRGLSKGFGYVDFETIDSATKAIAAMNQQLFEGRRLAVQYAAYESSTIEAGRRNRDPSFSKPLNPPSNTLFIGNMSFEMTDRDLHNLFKGIRNVVDIRVAIDRRTGQPRGFAHAEFIDVKSAVDGMKLLENKETYGRKLRLDYSYGPSRAPRNREQGEGESR